MINTQRLTRHKKIAAKALLTCLVIFHLSAVFVYAGSEKHNVIIINSYHKGMVWTDEETDGILSTLKDSVDNCMVYVEYIDWKRFPNEENLQVFYNSMKYKYGHMKVNAIIATDDIALKFALENRSGIFSNAPVVFSGINNVGLRDIVNGKDNVTGVIEEIDPVSTVEMALIVNPSLRNVYVVSDNTESGKSTGELTVKAIREYYKGLNIYTLNYSLKDLVTMVKYLDQNSIVLITSYYSDIYDKTVNLEEACREVSQNSTVPVFHLYDFGLNNGAIGGSMLSGRLQGVNAAKLAIRVLNGEKPSNIPPVSDRVTQKAFDYQQLTRFKVNVDRIPKGYEIVNRPFSFIETYKSLVYSVLGIFAVLVLFIFILLLYIGKVRNMKKELAANNEELTELYRELTSSEEELKQQIDEMCENREKLSISEERFRLAADGASNVIWDIDTSTGATFFSDKLYEMIDVGTDSDAKSWKRVKQYIHPEDIRCINEAFYHHVKGMTPFLDCEVRVKTRNEGFKWIHIRGKALRNENNRATRIAGSLTDITEKKNFAEEIKHLAYHDALTQLPNRALLEEKLSNELSNINASQTECALMFIDIDNFKYVNDTYGHSFGDKLLIEISKRICSSVGEEDFIARLGGDEFIVLTWQKVNNIYDIADNILKSLEAPFIMNNTLFHISASMGIAFCPSHGSNADELLKNADTAMYKAKASGKRHYKIYNKSMNDELAEKMVIEGKMRKALKNNEFTLFYQPQVDIDSKRICGLEALIRWTDPDLGFISPMKFIPIAEENGMIIQIGEWVMKTAVKFMKQLHDKGNNHLTVSVNVSIIQLIQENFVEMVLNILSDTGLKPEFLELEITESILMESFESNVDKLSELREKGVKIALDDFGKGYSSLSYLKQLPITTLKIDKIFIDDIISNQGADSITGSIIMIGQKMGLTVVAEGVETDEQFEYLYNNKCDKVQGYLFYKPVHEDDILRTLN